MRYRVIYDETARKMKRLGWWGTLKISGSRKIMSGPQRYCLHDNVLYLPEDESVLSDGHRLCWGSIREDELNDYPWLMDFDQEVPENPLDLQSPKTGIGFGVRYSKRHREGDHGRTAVQSFIAQNVLDRINEDPDILVSLSKLQFEELVAELFARMGFEVDLLRSSKDDGIDFLAIRVDAAADPIIMAVQTKHPDRNSNHMKRATLPVATVREIYGVAKAWNLAGACAITSSEYSPEAKRFADLKPHEIMIASGTDVTNWVRRYRWNRDE